MEPNNSRPGGWQTYPQRKTIRLPGYDYASAGHYFVTIVTANRELLFKDERYRGIGDNAWRWLAEHRAYVEIDEYVVMPNHLHGIVILRTNARGDRTPKSLSRLIGAFKTVSTKQLNELRGTPGEVLWQRSFHERIIRNERELNAIRQYIIDNPAKWDDDKNNPVRAVGAA
jgi:REP element-mobilizing transposase RayT